MEISGTEFQVDKKSTVLVGGGGGYDHALRESMAYTVPIFAKLKPLVIQTGR
jgi:hypothetical protein